VPTTRHSTPARIISDQHRQQLEHDSAIPAEVIQQRGYATVQDRQWLREHHLPPLPGLLLPIHGPDGSNGRYQLKPDEPRLDKKGKPRKYESQRGLPNVLDVPPRCQERLLDTATDLFITEGLKKADSLAGIGKTVIGITGVWNWQAKGELLRDWEPLLPSLPGRRVFIVFDSDAVSNKHVRLAEDSLEGAFLIERGADAYILRIPPEPDGSKNGADDFIARHGAAAFNHLVADTVKAAQDEVRDLRRQQSGIGRLMHNPKLTEAEARATYAIATDAGWLESRHGNGAYSVNYRQLAECGLSRDTIGKTLKRLDAEGVLTKAVTRERTGECDAQGRPKWTTVVRVTPPSGGFLGLVDAAAAIASDPPKHGGHPDRARCPDHSHAKVIKTRSRRCADCGRLITFDEHVYDPDADARLEPHDADSEQEALDQHGEQRGLAQERAPRPGPLASGETGGDCLRAGPGRRQPEPTGKQRRGPRPSDGPDTRGGGAGPERTGEPRDEADV
jgi:hypothetical protein